MEHPSIDRKNAVTALVREQQLLGTLVGALEALGNEARGDQLEMHPSLREWSHKDLNDALNAAFDLGMLGLDDFGTVLVLKGR